METPLILLIQLLNNKKNIPFNRHIPIHLITTLAY